MDVKARAFESFGVCAGLLLRYVCHRGKRLLEKSFTDRWARSLTSKGAIWRRPQTISLRFDDARSDSETILAASRSFLNARQNVSAAHRFVELGCHFRFVD
jgi:hypothetical protein